MPSAKRSVSPWCARARLPPHLRQINPTGKISLNPSGKSPLGLPPSCPRGRGVGHRHRTLGWDAVDAAASGAQVNCRAGFGLSQTRERPNGAQTNDAFAYGKTVWFWHPLLVLSRRRRVGPTGLRQSISADDGDKNEFVA